MTPTSNIAPSVPINLARHTLLRIRDNLVGLHGALILAEQQSYERLNGPIESVDTLLSLLQSDPWFTWLHPIADMLVRIDCLLEDESCEITPANVEYILREIDGLLYPSVEGDGFERAYYEAMDRSADVVLAHFRIRKLVPKAA